MMNKKFLVLFLGMLLLVGTVSAMDWDNSKDYDSLNKKATITNAFGFGKKIAEATLLTPKVNKVGVGYQRVAEIEIENYGYYKNALKKLELFNIKKNMKKFEREFDYKYLTEETYEIQIPKQDCENKSVNSSCGITFITETRTRKVWKDVGKDLPKGKTIVGIYTEVKHGDDVEWIPTWFGVKIKEWASWTTFDSGIVDDFEDDSINTGIWLTQVSGGSDSITESNGKLQLYNTFGDDPNFAVNVSFQGGDSFLDYGANISTHIANISIAGGQSGVPSKYENFTIFLVNDSGYKTSLWSRGGDKGYELLNQIIDIIKINSTKINLFENGTNTQNFTVNGNQTIKYENWMIQHLNRVVVSLETVYYDNSLFPQHSTIQINSPLNNTFYLETDIDFNVTIIARGGVALENATLFENSTGTWTEVETINLSGVENTTILESDVFHGDFNWYVMACDSDGDCGNSSINDLYPSEINITFPNGTINYHQSGTNLSLNWSVSEIDLDSCWYEYDGTNYSIMDAVCTNKNETSFNVTDKTKRSVIFFVNDTFGNVGSVTSTWNYSIFENSRTFNASSYATIREGYIINVSANNSLTSIELQYDGVEYNLTDGGNGIWSLSRTLISENIDSNDFNFGFTYGGSEIFSDNSTQSIATIVFGICNSTLNSPAINITFKDESDSSTINGTIPLSTFEYYLGDGSITQNYTYVNTTENPSYAFCLDPINRTFHIDPYAQYASSDYPQRIWDASSGDYNTTVTNQVLYLLSSANGNYQYFRVYSSSGQTLAEVTVNGTRVIGSETVVIAQGETDGSGYASFWLDADFLHNFYFFKEGYGSYETSIYPTGAEIVSITLSGEEGTTPEETNYIKKVSIDIKPSSNILRNNTSYNFNYTIATGYWALDEFGFVLKLGNGSIITTQSSTSDSSGGIVDYDFNTLNYSRIIMDYYYVINDTYINKSKFWIVENPSSFSLWFFFQNLNTYIDSDLFGLLGEDGRGTFGKAFISVLILVIVAGIFSYKFGIGSGEMLIGVIFGTLLLLNSLNFIPNPDFLTRVSLGDFLVYITGVLAVGLLLRGERT